jgi:hypothetical protein
MVGDLWAELSGVTPGKLGIYERSDLVKDGLTIELLILGGIDPLNPIP